RQAGDRDHDVAQPDDVDTEARRCADRLAAGTDDQAELRGPGQTDRDGAEDRQVDQRLLVQEQVAYPTIEGRPKGAQGGAADVGAPGEELLQQKAGEADRA